MVCATALASSATSLARPTDEGIRIDQLQPASPESMFFRAEGPHAPFTEGVEFAAGATFEYGKGLLRQIGVDKNGGEQVLAKLIEHAVIARISGSITPLHWLSFDLSVPFALFESGQKAKTYGGVHVASASAPGVGDIRIGAHFRPIDKKAFGLILGARGWAPIGSEGSYLADGNFRAEIDLGVAGELTRVLYGCTFNVSPVIFATRSGDRVAGACALHVKANDKFSIGVEPSFQLAKRLDAKDNGSFDVIFEPLGALRLRLGGFRLGVAAGPGFGGGPGAAEVRAMLNLAYVGLGKPPKPVLVGPSDRDLDKIPDAQDACPDEAGAPSRDKALNGCPARDRDGDGIRDDEDFCPDRAGIPHENKGANGCPDSDNDGLPDPIDTCKNEPGGAPSGCPKYARLTSGGFKVEPGIEFGKDERLSTEGRAALEEVAATMRANPKIEQVSISIGTKGAKAALSDKRAQEILLILRAGNLDSNRYEVVLRDDLRSGLVQIRLVR